jgi:hypothetical protein
VTKVLTARVPDELADWAEGYARERGVTRQALIEMALADFRESCRGGVPDVEPEPAEALRPTPVKGQVRPTSLTGAQVRAGQIVRASSLVGPSALALERQRRLNVSADRARRDGK